MSEYVRHDEEGPYFCFQAEIGPVVGRLATAGMFTHNFENRGVDHIFVQLGETEDSMTGPYLFRVAFDKDPEMFDRILAELRETGFSEVIADTPTDQDQEIFDRFIDQVFVRKVKNKRIKEWLDE